PRRAGSWQVVACGPGSADLLRRGDGRLRRRCGGVANRLHRALHLALRVAGLLGGALGGGLPADPRDQRLAALGELVVGPRGGAATLGDPLLQVTGPPGEELLEVLGRR